MASSTVHPKRLISEDTEKDLDIFNLPVLVRCRAGALRSAVQSHLKRLKYVKEYRLGEYGEGDAGVTIVTFK